MRLSQFCKNILFLQPLPYLVMSQVPENCQQFFVGAQTVVCSNSNKTRRVIYSRQQSLHQHKSSFESRRI